MKQIPDNTLAHYECMPQTHLHDFSAVNTQVFAHRVRAAKHKLGENMANPDKEAVQFYLFNHLASIIKNRYTKSEVLPHWACGVMREYKDIVTKQGLRLTTYLAMITVRESRHLHEKPEAWWDEMISKPFGKDMTKFHASKGGEQGILNQFLDHAPAIPVGSFFGATEVIFNKGKFSGGYGGKPWGNITKCLNQFLQGKISQEMMVDTAYTLAHNNGPMFNKGMVYEHHSSEFISILDIQRSGQMPELLIEKGAGSSLTQEQKQIWEAVRKAMPEEFGTYVDWYKVEALGSVGKYPLEKKQQDKKYGKKIESTKPIMLEGQQMLQTGVFEIAPNVNIKQYKRLVAA